MTWAVSRGGLALSEDGPGLGQLAGGHEEANRLDVGEVGDERGSRSAIPANLPGRRLCRPPSTNTI